MVNRHSTRKRSAARDTEAIGPPKALEKGRQAHRGDLAHILDRTSEARSVLNGGIRHVDERREARLPPADKAVWLRYGLNLPIAVHNDLDLALLHIDGGRNETTSKEADSC